MTAPLPSFDIKMPYAVRFQHGTSAYMAAVAGERNSGGADWHHLAAGAYTLQLTYDGPEAAEIWFDSTLGSSATRSIICKIAAGAGPRSSASIPVIVASAGGRLSVVTTPRSNAGATPTALASVRVIPDQTYKP